MVEIKNEQIDQVEIKNDKDSLGELQSLSFLCYTNLTGKYAFTEGSGFTIAEHIKLPGVINFMTRNHLT